MSHIEIPYFGVSLFLMCRSLAKNNITKEIKTLTVLVYFFNVEKSLSPDKIIY